MKLIKTALCLCVSAALISAGSACADDKAAKGEKGEKAEKKRSFVQQILPKGIEFSEEQNKKFEEIEKEFGPKLEAANKAARDALTKEQHKARNEAMQAAKAAGLKREAAIESANKALGLTEEQQKKLDEAEKTAQTLRQEFSEKVKAVLTDEQKAKLKEGKGKNKKTDAPKTEAPKTEAPKTEAPKTEEPKKDGK